MSPGLNAPKLETDEPTGAESLALQGEMLHDGSVKVSVATTVFAPDLQSESSQVTVGVKLFGAYEKSASTGKLPIPRPDAPKAPAVCVKQKFVAGPYVAAPGGLFTRSAVGVAQSAVAKPGAVPGDMAFPTVKFVVILSPAFKVPQPTVLIVMSMRPSTASTLVAVPLQPPGFHAITIVSPAAGVLVHKKLVLIGFLLHATVAAKTGIAGNSNSTSITPTRSHLLCMSQCNPNTDFQYLINMC